MRTRSSRQVTVHCPLCTKPIKVTVAPGEPPITGGPPDNWYPGSPPEAQEYDPQCECGDHPVVDKNKYDDTIFSDAIEKFELDW